jgi:hypothetical protein
VHEIREFAGLVPREEEPRPPHEKDLRGADPRRVKLVVDDDGAGAVERDPPTLIAKAVRGTAIRLPERLAQRDLDASREVVVVLLTSEVGDFLRDVAPRVSMLTRDLAQEVEASLRPQRRTQGRFAREDHVGSAGSKLGGGADLGGEARLSHRWRV